MVTSAKHAVAEFDKVLVERTMGIDPSLRHAVAQAGANLGAHEGVEHFTGLKSSPGISNTHETER
jgi:hypothetical protein